ncbi:hypothetical protein ASD74_02395 [Rhizobium sp. Root564]|nr:hypothetical protein ASD74_02395 [Rhizobium sp. Root564]
METSKGKSPRRATVLMMDGFSETDRPERDRAAARQKSSRRKERPLNATTEPRQQKRGGA